jgi:hypothetical protein
MDIQVAFLPGGHPTLMNYYPGIGIDAANAWYAGVHDAILWASSGASQVAVRAHPWATGYTFSGIITAGPNLVIPSCPAGYFADNTYAPWNTSYTNAYTDNKNRAIMVHELGHAMGLAHVDYDARCSAIMDKNVDPDFDYCQTYAPKWDDVFGIQALY